jgi:hypothetical protein
MFGFSILALTILAAGGLRDIVHEYRTTFQPMVDDGRAAAADDDLELEVVHSLDDPESAFFAA